MINSTFATLSRDIRRLVRVVEGARLESVYTSKRYRGFESLSLRKPATTCRLFSFLELFRSRVTKRKTYGSFSQPTGPNSGHWLDLRISSGRLSALTSCSYVHHWCARELLVYSPAIRGRNVQTTISINFATGASARVAL